MYSYTCVQSYLLFTHVGLLISSNKCVQSPKYTVWVVISALCPRELFVLRRGTAWTSWVISICVCLQILPTLFTKEEQGNRKEGNTSPLVIAAVSTVI